MKLFEAIKLWFQDLKAPKDICFWFGRNLPLRKLSLHNISISYGIDHEKVVQKLACKDAANCWDNS